MKKLIQNITQGTTTDPRVECFHHMMCLEFINSKIVRYSASDSRLKFSFKIDTVTAPQIVVLLVTKLANSRLSYILAPLLVKIMFSDPFMPIFMTDISTLSATFYMPGSRCNYVL